MTSALPIIDVTTIEEAIEAFLVERVAAIRATAVQKGTRFLFTSPAIAVSIFETGEFVPEGQRSYRVPCAVHILVTFTSARSEEDRRKGINPLVIGIVQTLMQQSLGLKLCLPGLVPKRFRDVSTEEDWGNNKIVYDIEFGCSFNLEATPEETTNELLRIGLNYFQPPEFDFITDVVTLEARV
jgi:hypothetical protein